MKKGKAITIKDIGFVTSIGGNRSNNDYFNVFTKEALFNYDISKKIYEYCLKARDLEGVYGMLDKRKIETENIYMDNIGNQISILKINVPELGEGIAYIFSPHLFNNSFIKKYVDFDKPPHGVTNNHILVEDETICFGFFDIRFDFAFNKREKLNFYNTKNKANLDKFKKYIDKKYKNTLTKRNMGGDNIIECSVPNGKYEGHLMVLKKTIPNSTYEKGFSIGSLFIRKK